MVGAIRADSMAEILGFAREHRFSEALSGILACAETLKAASSGARGPWTPAGRRVTKMCRNTACECARMAVMPPWPSRASEPVPSSQRRRLLGAAAGISLLAPAGAIAASLCANGLRQSPIDVEGTHRRPLPPLSFDYRPEPLRIVNDGHTVRVRCSASTMRVGAEPHRLQQFHFHLPGGDTIRGEPFPLGLHFPHKSGAGQLVTLVLLFREGRRHAALDALLPRMPAAGEPERSPPDARADPAAWLPSAWGYYRYDGSLTSPPCTEGVAWLILKEVQEVSAGQLADLRRLIRANARPVQPRHGRVILESP